MPQMHSVSLSYKKKAATAGTSYLFGSIPTTPSRHRRSAAHCAPALIAPTVFQIMPASQAPQGHAVPTPSHVLSRDEFEQPHPNGSLPSPRPGVPVALSDRCARRNAPPLVPNPAAKLLGTPTPSLLSLSLSSNPDIHLSLIRTRIHRAPAAAATQ